MKIRRLIIRNFRGIKNLEWTLDDDGLICLIGHGDSTKTTILKAIEYVLYPKWNLQLSDADFYECKPNENQIEIEVIIGQIDSHEFNSDSLFSVTKNFWDITNKILSDSSQAEHCETAMRIILRVDSSLEPIWTIANESGEEETIKHSQRKMFNMVRLDDHRERNFKWGYNSILSKLLEKDGRNDIRSILAEAGRQSRNGFEESSIPSEFMKCAKIVSEEAKLWGTGHDKLKPYLDVFSADSLCLNDDYNVPIYMLGAGSKKLMLIAIEKYLISDKESPENHIILLDEVENGLEPHRLMHVIFTLWEIVDNSESQIFLSTHSPIALREIAGNGTYRVKNNNGEIKIKRLDSTANSNIRTNPEGYFLKKIVICEGKTEIGVLRRFKKKWIEENEIPPEHHGAYFILGDGSSMAKYSEAFKDAGYDVCIYRDSDREITVSEEIGQFKYDSNLSIEEAVCKDAPETLIKEIIKFCTESEDVRLHSVPRKDSYDNNDREELAKFLHDNEAFRRIDTGEKFGDMILPHWEDMKEGTFIQTITKVKDWIYNNQNA